MRALAANGVFTCAGIQGEGTPGGAVAYGAYGHSPLSCQLRRDHPLSLAHIALFCRSELHQVRTHNLKP